MIKTTLRQYQREFINDDGTTEIWKYDLDKFNKGPIESTTIYPKSYKSPLDIIKAKNKDVPLTKQQWFNPANGKMVGYTRAKALNLIK
jgi:hypothetical protein